MVNQKFSLRSFSILFQGIFNLILFQNSVFAAGNGDDFNKFVDRMKKDCPEYCNQFSEDTLRNPQNWQTFGVGIGIGSSNSSSSEPKLNTPSPYSQQYGQSPIPVPSNPNLGSNITVPPGSSFFGLQGPPRVTTEVVDRQDLVNQRNEQERRELEDLRRSVNEAHEAAEKSAEKARAAKERLLKVAKSLEPDPLRSEERLEACGKKLRENLSELNPKASRLARMAEVWMSFNETQLAVLSAIEQIDQKWNELKDLSCDTPEAQEMKNAAQEALAKSVEDIIASGRKAGIPSKDVPPLVQKMNASVAEAMEKVAEVQKHVAETTENHVCFPAETLIPSPLFDEQGKHIGSQLVRISSVKVGDWVYSCKLDSLSCQLARVSHVFQREAKKLVEISVQGKTIQATPNHPFYVVNRGEMIPAQDLNPQDLLLDIGGNKLQQDQGIREIEGEFTVYNIEVEEHHTYYAESVLVHNCNSSKNVNFKEGGATAGLDAVGKASTVGCVVTGVACAAEVAATVVSGATAPVTGGAIPVAMGVGAGKTCAAAFATCSVAGTTAFATQAFSSAEGGGETDAGGGNNPTDEKPLYENPGMHDPSNSARNLYNPSKSVLPKNHKELWDKSVESAVDGNRWTKIGDGKKSVYHRFQNDGNGKWHWNGSTDGVTKSGQSRPIRPNDVPIDIKKLPGT